MDNDSAVKVLGNWKQYRSMSVLLCGLGLLSVYVLVTEPDVLTVVAAVAFVLSFGISLGMWLRPKPVFVFDESGLRIGSGSLVRWDELRGIGLSSIKPSWFNRVSPARVLKFLPSAAPETLTHGIPRSRKRYVNAAMRMYGTPLIFSEAQSAEDFNALIPRLESISALPVEIEPETPQERVSALGARQFGVLILASSAVVALVTVASAIFKEAAWLPWVVPAAGILVGFVALYFYDQPKKEPQNDEF